jgi:hypothetical protein
MSIGVPSGVRSRTGRGARARAGADVAPDYRTGRGRRTTQRVAGDGDATVSAVTGATGPTRSVQSPRVSLAVPIAASIAPSPCRPTRIYDRSSARPSAATAGAGIIALTSPPNVAISFTSEEAT